LDRIKLIKQLRKKNLKIFLIGIQLAIRNTEKLNKSTEEAVFYSLQSHKSLSATTSRSSLKFFWQKMDK